MLKLHVQGYKICGIKERVIPMVHEGAEDCS